MTCIKSHLLVNLEIKQLSILPRPRLMKIYFLYPILQVQLLIYFMLKYAIEILLSESSVVTTYYFGWTTGYVSIFLAFLGLTVIPVNLLLGCWLSNKYEAR